MPSRTYTFLLFTCSILFTSSKQIYSTIGSRNHPVKFQEDTQIIVLNLNLGISYLLTSAMINIKIINCKFILNYILIVV